MLLISFYAGCFLAILVESFPLRRLAGALGCALGRHAWQRQGFAAVGLLQVQNLRCQRCGTERIKDTTGRALRALSRMINRTSSGNGSVQ